jgi:hypothetical protein
MKIYYNYAMQLEIIPMILLLLFLPCLVIAQPTTFTSTLVDGVTETNQILTDKGMFRQTRLQATASSTNVTWYFPKSTGNMTEVWRPATENQMIQGFNVIIDPGLSSASARYQTNAGGFSGLLPPVTANNYYTINVSELQSASNQYMSVMETSYIPVQITGVSQPEFPPDNIDQTIAVTTSVDPHPEEVFYIRYSTDNFVTSDTTGKLQFTGNNGITDIPAFPVGTTVKYYTFSTVSDTIIKNLNGLSLSMATLEFNNNGGAYYSYTTEAALPVLLGNLWSEAEDEYVTVSWTTLNEVNNEYFTIEKYLSDKWVEVGTVEARFGRGVDNAPYQWADDKPIAGVNYYRLLQTDYNGEPKVLGETSAFFLISHAMVFPNPVSTYLNVPTEHLPKGSKINIMDIVGRRLIHAPVVEGIQTIDMSHLPKGIYQMIIQDKANNPLTGQRIVKN